MFFDLDFCLIPQNYFNCLLFNSYQSMKFAFPSENKTKVPGFQGIRPNDLAL
jgi:hypothetical protein